MSEQNYKHKSFPGLTEELKNIIDSEQKLFDLNEESLIKLNNILNEVKCQIETKLSKFKIQTLLFRKLNPNQKRKLIRMITNDNKHEFTIWRNNVLDCQNKAWEFIFDQNPNVFYTLSIKFGKIVQLSVRFDESTSCIDPCITEIKDLKLLAIYDFKYQPNESRIFKPWDFAYDNEYLPTDIPNVFIGKYKLKVSKDLSFDTEIKKVIPGLFKLKKLSTIDLSLLHINYLSELLNPPPHVKLFLPHYYKYFLKGYRNAKEINQLIYLNSRFQKDLEEITYDINYLSHNNFMRINDKIKYLNLHTFGVSIDLSNLDAFEDLQIMVYMGPGTDGVFSGLANLKNLKALKLMFSVFSYIPSGLKNLHDLEHLEIYMDKLKNDFLDFPKLKSLKLSSENPSVFPTSVLRIENLEVLDLIYAEILNLDKMDAILNHPKLRFLFLHEKNMENLPEWAKNQSKIKIMGDPKSFYLDDIPKSESLSISEKEYEEVVELIKGKKIIKSLSLSECNISELPECIFEHEELLYVKISKCPITRLPESLKKLVNLQKLELSKSELTEIPEWLSSMNSIRILELTELPKIKNIENIKLSPELNSLTISEEFLAMNSLYNYDISGLAKIEVQINSDMDEVMRQKLLDLRMTFPFNIYIYYFKELLAKRRR